MIFVDFLYALVIAGILSLVLANLARWRVPGRDEAWVALLFLFALFFLGVWAGGVWLTPIGPPLFGGYWVPFIIVGVFLALVLVAVMPASPRSAPAEGDIEQEGAQAALGMFGCVFWALILGLVGAIAARYLWGPDAFAPGP